MASPIIARGEVNILNKFVQLGQLGESKKYLPYQDIGPSTLKKPVQLVKNIWMNALRGLANSLRFALSDVNPILFVQHSIVGIGSLLAGLAILPVAAIGSAVLGLYCSIKGAIAGVKAAIAYLKCQKGSMGNALKTALHYAAVAVLASLVGILNSLPVLVLRIGSDSLRLKYCQLLEKLYSKIEGKVPQGLRTFVRFNLGLEQEFYKTIKKDIELKELNGKKEKEALENEGQGMLANLQSIADENASTPSPYGMGAALQQLFKQEYKAPVVVTATSVVAPTFLQRAKSALTSPTAFKCYSGAALLATGLFASRGANVSQHGTALLTAGLEAGTRIFHNFSDIATTTLRGLAQVGAGLGTCAAVHNLTNSTAMYPLNASN